MEKDLQLIGDTILLRPYRGGDISHLWEAVCESFAELSIRMYWCHDDHSIEDYKIWIESQPESWEKGTNYSFAIIDSSVGSLLGTCSLSGINYNDQVAQVGYWIRTSRTKQGIATKAIRLLAHFGFSKLNMNRLEIVIAVDNRASQRVAEKVGAVQEGIMRNRLAIRDKLYDAVMFSLLPHDLTHTSLNK